MLSVGNLLGQVILKVLTLFKSIPLFMLDSEQGIGFQKTTDEEKKMLA